MTSELIENLKKAMTPVPIEGTTKVLYGDFEVDSFLTEAEAQLIKFKPTELDKAFEKNTGVMAYYGHLSGKAIKQESQMKVMRDFMRAAVADEIRKIETETNGKKPSEAFVESAVDKDIRIVQVTAAYGATMEVSEALKVLCDAARRRGSDLNYFAEKAVAEKQAKAAFKT